MSPSFTVWVHPPSASTPRRGAPPAKMAQQTQPLAAAAGDSAVDPSDVTVASGLSRPLGYVKLGSPLPFRVPSCAEEITQDWLTEVFRFRGYLKRDGRVGSLTMKSIGEGQGAFGDLVLISITLEAGECPCPSGNGASVTIHRSAVSACAGLPHAPTSFVAKFAPVCNSVLKRMETRRAPPAPAAPAGHATAARALAEATAPGVAGSSSSTRRISTTTSLFRRARTGGWLHTFPF